MIKDSQLSKFIERNSNKQVWFGTRSGLFGGILAFSMDLDGVITVDLQDCKYLSSSNEAYIGRLTIKVDDIFAWESNE